MKIAVLIKYCPDSEASIEIVDGKLNLAGAKFSVSPYDEYASEEALKLMEANPGSEVVLFTVGPERNAKGIKDELARGATRGVHILTDEENTGCGRTAEILAAAIKAEKPDLILCGWKGIDFDCGLTGSWVAEVMGLPHVTLVTKLIISGNKATCHRQVEGGEEIIEVPLPALIGAQKGLNEPRYPSLKGIMAAKKKPVETKKLTDLGMEIPPACTAFMDFEKPVVKQGGKKFEGTDSVKEVVRLLREEAKVI
jgi:electron transfer flavoprotein beta subunit